MLIMVGGGNPTLRIIAAGALAAGRVRAGMRSRPVKGDRGFYLYTRQGVRIVCEDRKDDQST
jgi:hypothetical protein